jgi:ribosomal protein L40E
MNRKLLFGLGVIGVIAADLVARTVLTGSPASSIGLLDAVFVVGGIALIQRWYKQEETASPQVPTPSPAIRAKTQAPTPEYSHAPPAATSPPDDLGQQMSDSAPDQSQSSVLLCSECGHENPAEMNFCTKCRAKMTLECNKCGFKSPQGSEFCGSCGEDTEFRLKKMARNAALAAEVATAARVREAEAVDRARLRPVVSYSDKGQLEVKGGKKEGKWHGPYESYHKNGQLLEKGTYKEGKWDGPYARYQKNGRLLEKGIYREEKWDGPYERYHENGQLFLKATYKEGKLDGLYEYWSSNGQSLEKGTFNMAERCGEWIEQGETVTYDPC